MKLTYINYLRLINNKLIREGVYLPIQISDDMSVAEIERVKTILEGYCYFNEVLSKCDSAYALQLVNGCSAKLYTDVVKEDVFKKYKDKFDNALSLLCQDTPNPLDSTVTIASLSNYLNKNGKEMSVEDLAIEVDGVSSDTGCSFQYSDIFSIKQSRDLEYVDEEDSDDDFDYSEEVEESEDYTSDDSEVDDDDVYFNFTSGSDDEEDYDYSTDESEIYEDEYTDSDSDLEDYEDSFDYSDDSENSEVLEELPLSDDDDSVFFNFNGNEEQNKEGIDSDEFSYDEEENYEEDYYLDSDDVSYEDDTYEDDEVSYEDDEISYEEDTDISYEDDDFSYEDNESSDEDDFYEEEPYEDESEDFSYEEDPYEEEFNYDDSSSSEDGDEFSYEDDSSYDNSDMPVFNVGSTVPTQVSQPRKKEDYERSAETIQGIVDGGTRILKKVGVKMKDSLFTKKD